MKKAVKSLMCIALSMVFVFGLFGCSANLEMTDENVRETVDIAITALKEFDTDKLDAYVDSSTLGVIVSYAKDHEQFAELGRAMFANLEVEILDVDLNAKAVTVNVKNNDLFILASNFTAELKSQYSTMELPGLLDDEYFLDTTLKMLTDSINNETFPATPAVVTLTITEGKKNLMVSVDEDAEDAFSGGALSAVKSAFGF